MRTMLFTKFGLIFAAVSSQVSASDFAVSEKSAADLGRANAGQATQTDDAAAALNNPALMTGYDRITVTGVATGIAARSRYVDLGSLDAIGQPLGGDTSGFIRDAIVPAFYSVFPLGERLAAGFAVSAPFGLSSRY